MGTDVSLVVAFGGSDEARCLAWEYARDWWFQEAADLWDEIVVNDQPGGRAAALNVAVGDACGDVIIQADADSLVPVDTLRTAVALARTADGLVVPHSRYLYLTKAATALVYAGADPFSAAPGDCDESGTGGVGNVTVFSRATWEACGGYDERFTGWGGDDAVFRYTAEALVRPTRRLVGDVVHLWHPRPPASVPGGPGYSEQFALVALFRDAAAVGPDAVRKLMEQQ